MFLLALFCLLMGKEGIVFIAFLQFFMGAWQLISALVTTANSRHGDAVRTTTIRIYWAAVAGYFLVLAALGMTIEDLAIIWFFCAWLIAIYYYVLTIRLVFVIPERKTFLDVANE